MYLSFDALINILQVAIGPVILVSGVGLLLLTMTNRFGRILDRSRLLTQERHPSSAEQLVILMRRAHILRAAIALATLCVLLAAVMIITLFMGPLLKLGSPVLVAALFVSSMLALIASLVLFMADLNLSLRALILEVDANRARRD